MIPREFLDEIRSLRNEVCGQYLPSESDDESTLQAIDDLEHPLDNEEEPDTFSTGADLDNILTEQESTNPLSSFRARFGLMVATNTEKQLRFGIVRFPSQ